MFSTINNFCQVLSAIMTYKIHNFNLLLMATHGGCMMATWWLPNHIFLNLLFQKNAENVRSRMDSGFLQIFLVGAQNTSFPHHHYFFGRNASLLYIKTPQLIRIMAFYLSLSSFLQFLIQFS